jgi:hypothetical protein
VDQRQVYVETVRYLAVMTLVVGACGFEGQGELPTPMPGDKPDAAEPIPTIDAAMPPLDSPPRDPCDGDGDDDGDSVCNSVDQWPCGEEPTDQLSNSITMTHNGNETRIVLDQIQINTRSEQFVVADGGSSFQLAARYSIDDTACPGNCIDQIEYGFMPSRRGCLFDETVDRNDGARGDFQKSWNLPRPTTPTVYELRVAIGQNYSCTYNGASGWYLGAPPAAYTIAKVCVR